jgi:hypothetical protein
VKTIRVTEEEGKAAVHMEFNADGTEVWVSVWNRADAGNPTGEIVVYDAKTLDDGLSWHHLTAVAEEQGGHKQLCPPFF